MKKHNLLIINKNLDENNQLINILSESFDICTAASLTEDLFESRIHVILLNHTKDPLEELKKIRTQPQTVHTPVALLTERLEALPIQELIDTGINDIHYLPLHNELLKLRMLNLATISKKSDLIKNFMMTDEITGLANKKRFIEQLDIEWARAERTFNTIALMFINIDNFKRINQIDGTKKGDSLLRILGGILRQNVKRPTDFIARLNDDRFGIILPETEHDGAAILCGNILHQIHEEPLIPANFSIRIGVACTTPIDKDALQEFVDQSRIAAEQAKQTPEHPFKITTIDHI